MAKVQKVMKENDQLILDSQKSPPVYTYVGGGEDSPRVINFMGLQQFVRGEAVEVSHPQVLAKIKNNPSFTQGEVAPTELNEYDVQAKKEADEQRKKDVALNRAILKQYGKE